ncbi:hypothetical protein [Pseudanabaena sp. PCC 6802]|uniref:hypothetical protein n=1 Tax=Pseudanabaena sp. PCC 6802 TaxID=118173 RepID=UPI00034DCAF3|nr:hypothetical protein [Pseudanabaena sp. PCC 6802]
MNSKTSPIKHLQQTETLGEQVRKVADRLRQETDLQIKVTSRILGAAAQIAQNHDRLIDEVVDMVEEDLEKENLENQARLPEATNTYTVDRLKKKYKTLREATSHFGVKAKSWDTLVEKISISLPQKVAPTSNFETLVIERLNTIENEIGILRAEISQVLLLLQQFSPSK